MSKAKLKINARVTRLTNNTTKTVRLVREYLDGLPKHVACDSSAIADALKTSIQRVRTWGGYIGDEYRVRVTGRFLYGNPETIKLYREGFYDQEGQ